MFALVLQRTPQHLCQRPRLVGTVGPHRQHNLAPPTWRQPPHSLLEYPANYVKPLPHVHPPTMPPPLSRPPATNTSATLARATQPSAPSGSLSPPTPPKNPPISRGTAPTAREASVPTAKHPGSSATCAIAPPGPSST